jgi:hypothetical protein
MPQFVSAGAMSGQAVQEYLMQREQQRRQQMLDALVQRRESRDDEIKRAQLDINRTQMEALNEQRAAQTAERGQREALTRARAYDVGDIVGQDDVAALRRTVPGILQAQTTLPARSLDMSTDPMQAGAPKVPGVVMPAEPTGAMTYRGTPEQREGQRSRDRLSTYMADPNTPEPVKRFLGAQQATGDSSLPYQLFAPQTPTRVTFSQPQTRIVDGQRMDVRAGSDGFWYSMNGTRIDDPRRVKPEPNRANVDTRTRDNPLLPRGVEAYLGRLKRDGRSREDAQSEVYAAWDSLVRDHPNLSPTSVEQAFGRLWPDDGIFGGAGNDQLSVPGGGEEADTDSVFDNSDDEPRSATSADVARVAQAMGISHSDARRRLEAQGVAVVD